MDWGPKANMEVYGIPTPPPYNLTTVTAPVILFWADNDWLAVPKVYTILILPLNLHVVYNTQRNSYV